MKSVFIVMPLMLVTAAADPGLIVGLQVPAQVPSKIAKFEEVGAVAEPTHPLWAAFADPHQLRAVVHLLSFASPVHVNGVMTLNQTTEVDFSP
jgi:hypothetical protein